MAFSSEQEKGDAFRSALQIFLNNTEDATTLMALFITYDKATNGSEKLDIREIAKAISDVSGKRVSIQDGLKLANDYFNKPLDK